ncbi:MAG TPA: hypothetical protein VMZ03_12945 [Chitinophagaceae bacterium]|nr:hypothetical protein [Chitinophagaceae bacterium]
MRNSLCFFTILVLLISCTGKKDVVKSTDYNQYLQYGTLAVQVKKARVEKEFWQQRLHKEPGSYINMLEVAKYELSLFKLTGDIQSLRNGDSLLKASSARLNNTDPELLFSLSQNSITQHQFRQAAFYNTEAENRQGDMFIIRLLQFDTWMELGQYDEAYQSLESIRDKTSFDYLIRRAKWEDHKGDLDKAIELMEQAFEMVKHKKKSIYCWTLSNLADMYGHAGRVKKSYEAYLDVLSKEPSNLYCLKGIAWIALAHDNNTAEAKKILLYILSQTTMPDLKLMLAEIAEVENKPAEKGKWIGDFIADVSKPGYGGMYNKYLIHIYSENPSTLEKAFVLAQRELKNRFTPETCDWMAWVEYKRGHYSEALRFTKNYVYKHSFEPAALMHTGFIYAANGKQEEARNILETCLESTFELGPVAAKEIKEKLASIHD